MKMKKKMLCLGMVLVLGMMILSGCKIRNYNSKLIDINNGEDGITLGYANFVFKYNQARYDTQYGDSYGAKLWTEDMTGMGQTFADQVKDNIVETLETQYVIKKHADEYTPQEVTNLATLIARIIDFKSHYTCKHSLGVAKRAEAMAIHFNYDQEKTIRYYLAGALHDVGKLMIHNSILKKPGRLTDEEYLVMKNHAHYTYEILKNLKGMQDITTWASHHHEKLNGEGYPFGLTAKELSQEERTMTCVDIYQALAEERPYKKGFPHNQVMQMMYEMARKGELDETIVDEVHAVFRFYHLEDQVSVTEILVSQ